MQRLADGADLVRYGWACSYSTDRCRVRPSAFPGRRIPILFFGHPLGLEQYVDARAFKETLRYRVGLERPFDGVEAECNMRGWAVAARSIRPQFRLHKDS